MGRVILAGLIGVISGGMVVGLVEMAGQALYPLPAGIDLNDPQVLRAAVADQPFGTFLWVLLAWGLGSLVGGWVATRLARSASTTLALIVGGILLLAGIFNLVTLSGPLWFWVAGLVIFLPAAWLGGRLGQTQ